MSKFSSESIKLYEEGYCVIPIFSSENMESLSQQFSKTCEEAKELKPVDEIGEERFRFCLGGVGYIPLPSVFYHPFVRSLYAEAYKKAQDLKIFEFYKSKAFSENDMKDVTCKLVPDRPLYRFPDQVVCETGKWHRDIAPKLGPENEDVCFGGWVNLNFDKNQHFKAYKQSHQSNHPIVNRLSCEQEKRIGFSNFKKEDQTVLRDNWELFGGGLITIPPGHMLIFRESLIHVVKKNPPINTPILRIHTSFLLSTNPVPLFDRPDLEDLRRKKKVCCKKMIEYFREQRMLPVRSGQLTPTYTIFNTWGKNKEQLIRLSNHYISDCTDKSGIIKKYLPSLEELNLLHDPLSNDEIEMYI